MTQLIGEWRGGGVDPPVLLRVDGGIPGRAFWSKQAESERRDPDRGPLHDALVFCLHVHRPIVTRKFSGRYGARILSTTVHYASCIKIGDKKL
jgi:hypothetical protein